LANYSKQINGLSNEFCAERLVTLRQLIVASRGMSVAEYRRGLDERKHQRFWQKLWHFSEHCEHYPTRNFMTRPDRPPDDELCARCNNGA
jgi:hypothetical protein